MGGRKKAGPGRPTSERVSLPVGWRARLFRYVIDKHSKPGELPNVLVFLNVTANTIKAGEREGRLTHDVLERIESKLNLTRFELLEILRSDPRVPMELSHDLSPGRNRPEYTVPKLFACSIKPSHGPDGPAYGVYLKPARVRLCDPSPPTDKRVVGILSLGEIWMRIEAESDQVRVSYQESVLEQRTYADGSVSADMGGQEAPHVRLMNRENGLDGQYLICNADGATFQALQEEEAGASRVTLEVTCRGGFHFDKPNDPVERTPGGERSEAERTAFARAVEAWIKVNSDFKPEDFDADHPPTDLIPNENTSFRLASVHFKAGVVSDGVDES